MINSLRLEIMQKDFRYFISVGFYLCALVNCLVASLLSLRSPVKCLNA